MIATLTPLLQETYNDLKTMPITHPSPPIVKRVITDSRIQTQIAQLEEENKRHREAAELTRQQSTIPNKNGSSQENHNTGFIGAVLSTLSLSTNQRNTQRNEAPPKQQDATIQRKPLSTQENHRTKVIKDVRTALSLSDDAIYINGKNGSMRVTFDLPLDESLHFNYATSFKSIFIDSTAGENIHTLLKHIDYFLGFCYKLENKFDDKNPLFISFKLSTINKSINIDQMIRAHTNASVSKNNEDITEERTLSSLSERSDSTPGNDYTLKEALQHRELLKHIEKLWAIKKVLLQATSANATDIKTFQKNECAQSISKISARLNLEADISIDHSFEVSIQPLKDAYHEIEEKWGRTSPDAVIAIQRSLMEICISLLNDFKKTKPENLLLSRNENNHYVIELYARYVKNAIDSCLNPNVPLDRDLINELKTHPNYRTLSERTYHLSRDAITKGLIIGLCLGLALAGVWAALAFIPQASTVMLAAYESFAHATNGLGMGLVGSAIKNGAHIAVGTLFLTTVVGGAYAYHSHTHKREAKVDIRVVPIKRKEMSVISAACTDIQRATAPQTKGKMKIQMTKGL